MEFGPCPPYGGGILSLCSTDEAETKSSDKPMSSHDPAGEEAPGGGEEEEEEGHWICRPGE